MRDNSHINKAKETQDDEFYTTYENAEKSINPFSHHFSGKSILCNTDDPKFSEVYRYLADNFKKFNLSKLVAVGLNSDMAVMTEPDKIQSIQVKNDGDFRTGESLKALKECDIVVSNPPFSNGLFTDFIKLCLENNKDLVAIGPLDGAKYVDVKESIVSGKLHCIKSPFDWFIHPIDSDYEVKNVKVALFTTFKEDPFGKKFKFDDSVKIEDLPTDTAYAAPVSVFNESFSVKHIPSVAVGSEIIVPLEILRKDFSDKFKIKEILPVVKTKNKTLMSGILMEYI